VIYVFIVVIIQSKRNPVKLGFGVLQFSNS